MPLTDSTISEIEKCNTQVRKFILQIPRSSSNASAYIDAGLRPIWSLIAEKVLLYASSVMSKPLSYWPKIALNVNLSSGFQSSYTKYLIRWKKATNCLDLPPKQIKTSVTRAAIAQVIEQNKSTLTTTFAMDAPSPSMIKQWFRPKSWVTDGGYSKIYSEFRVSNIGLGNRGPAKNGVFYKLCPLCIKSGVTALNNEVRCLNWSITKIGTLLNFRCIYSSTVQNYPSTEQPVASEHIFLHAV